MPGTCSTWPWGWHGSCVGLALSTRLALFRAGGQVTAGDGGGGRGIPLREAWPRSLGMGGGRASLVLLAFRFSAIEEGMGPRSFGGMGVPRCVKGGV